MAARILSQQMRLLHLILPAFVLCLWTCGQGDDEAPLPPPPEPEIIVDCVEIGDDSKLVPNNTGVVWFEPRVYTADLNEDGQIDLKIEYDLLNAVSGAWREELEFFDIDPRVRILGTVTRDTIISFYRENCYHQINIEDYVPEAIDSLVTEEVFDYLEVERLNFGDSVCVEDIPDSYSNGIVIKSYSRPQDQYVCGVIRYKLGNWENFDSEGYIAFLIEANPHDYIGYTKIQNNYGAHVTEIRYQRAN
ncbi:MAG: hypothetical protein AAFN81_00460 [Bacteroidota bacterium]